jgi:hypothetical protein
MVHPGRIAALRALVALTPTESIELTIIQNSERAIRWRFIGASQVLIVGVADASLYARLAAWCGIQ